MATKVSTILFTIQCAGWCAAANRKWMTKFHLTLALSPQAGRGNTASAASREYTPSPAWAGEGRGEGGLSLGYVNLNRCCHVNGNQNGAHSGAKEEVVTIENCWLQSCCSCSTARACTPWHGKVLASGYGLGVRKSYLARRAASRAMPTKRNTTASMMTPARMSIAIASRSARYDALCSRCDHTSIPNSVPSATAPSTSIG